VQKTGGAALTGAISNRFAERECLLLYYSPPPDISDLETFRYVSGHLPISFLDRFANPPFVFTLLRDPVERALSAYSFYRTRPPEFAKRLLLFGRGRPAYERAAECLRLARTCRIEELVERAPEIATEYFGNRQARALAGSRPEGGDERLEDALAGLECCDFVGLTDRLDESAGWLARRLGWRELTPLPRINVTGERLRADQVSAKALEALQELTSVDRQLYRVGVRRYESQLADWRHAEDPRDHSAAIADAPRVSDLSFDQAIQGAGWVGRERVDGTSFCWVGHTNRAWVDLATDHAASEVVVELAHVLDPSIVESLRISVDGSPVRHRLVESNGAVIAGARLKRRRILRGGGLTRVTLEVSHSTRPCDVDPGSNDDRLLSVAVRRIALQRT
jgi:hypothetical protein